MEFPGRRRDVGARVAHAQGGGLHGLHHGERVAEGDRRRVRRRRRGGRRRRGARQETPPGPEAPVSVCREFFVMTNVA